MAVLDVEAGGAAGGRQELELSWTDVTYDVVTDKKEPLRLLHGVSGRCAPGEMVAVMGPSGCGKSTLLNCLAMRWNKGLGGSIMVNGRPRPSHFKRLCGYSTQDNPFLRVFSVKETLTFFARLRLPHGTPAAEVARRVDEVMAELDLTVSVHAAGPGGVGGGRRTDWRHSPPRTSSSAAPRRAGSRAGRRGAWGLRRSSSACRPSYCWTNPPPGWTPGQLTASARLWRSMPRRSGSPSS